MLNTDRPLAACCILALLCVLGPAAPRPVAASPGVHVTFLWHLEQPIYWPAPNASGLRYQTVWDSLEAKRGGARHPENDLDSIFFLDDRLAAYQYRPRDAVRAMLGQPEAGAQVSYSGGLIENIASLAAHGAGYGDWNGPFREGQNWLTPAGKPRLDIVQFSFHHALLPLLDAEVARKELQLYRQIYGEAWDGNRRSRGLFPSEMAFAEHLIPILVEEGIDWVVVSNHHLSRACADYPWVRGSGGDNIPPPNRADVQNPAQGYYNRISIDRGVSPANAVPFSYLPHRARYVDPASGRASTLIVVPAAQSESWQDGYSCFSTGPIAALAPHADPARPMLLLLAHDGDNAFGGGYSYYMECTPNLVGAAAGAGYPPTTVEQYLADHPVPADDLVHVEDGAWVNADGDFGAPSFLNWNWPLVNARGEVDPATGWAEDERNWAVITAATNEVRTATALEGEPDLGQVLHPDRGGDAVARAWHYLLGALNSGYMYYGKALDMELKPIVACNEAVAQAGQVLARHPGQDPLGPTIWLPQRWPDNPGGVNFGPLYGYREVQGPADFLVWTFVHDVSEVRRVVLHLRRDADGENPLRDDANETYAGGPGVSCWRAIPMQGRPMPGHNVVHDPEIDDSILPTRIAQVYWTEVRGYRNLLLDYYVEAEDRLGHVSRSPIRHVWVGDGGSGSSGGGDPDGVHWDPPAPTRSQLVTIFSPDAGELHWGINSWQAPPAALWPAGTREFPGGQAVDTPLAGPDGDGFYHVTLGPFEGLEPVVTTLDFVIHRADGSWNNNQGQDFHITVREGGAEGEGEGEVDIYECEEGDGEGEGHEGEGEGPEGEGEGHEGEGEGAGPEGEGEGAGPEGEGEGAGPEGEGEGAGPEGEGEGAGPEGEGEGGEGAGGEGEAEGPPVETSAGGCGCAQPGPRAGGLTSAALLLRLFFSR